MYFKNRYGLKKDIEKLRSWSGYGSTNMVNNYASDNVYINDLINIKKELPEDKEETSENSYNFKNKIIQISPDDVFTYLSKGYQVFKMGVYSYIKIHLNEKTVDNIIEGIQKDKNNEAYVYFVLETNKETTHEE